MGEILQNLPVYMMIGIVVVIAVSQFFRIAGAALGVLFWAAVTIVGSFAYREGHAIGFPGLPFSLPVFLSFCAGFALLHVFIAWQHLRVRRRRNTQREMWSQDD